MDKDCSVVICAVFEQDGAILCLFDESPQSRKLWRLPSGRVYEAETDVETAVIRILSQLAGIRGIRKEHINFVFGFDQTMKTKRGSNKVDRHVYETYCCVVQITTDQFLGHRQLPPHTLMDFFSAERIRSMRAFVPNHKKVLRTCGLVKPQAA